jgi:hypothetical protein
MSNEVTELIGALQNGRMTLEEVADRFRERSWPRRDTEKANTYLDLATAAERDPGPYIEGSFDDVAAAFHRGALSDIQYEVLAQAMADSMRQEDQSKDSAD